jgi:ketosteroid isomerase-like protein
MSLKLPARPHLDLLKRQAKAALRVGRALHPEWRLADAQRALARGYGLASWKNLKQAIGAARQVSEAAPRAMSPARTGGGPEPEASATPPRRFNGSWITRDTAPDPVALEITELVDGLLLTQVVAPIGGNAIASSLLLRTDGREQPLPLGEDLRLRAVWTDPQTLHTTVRRGNVTMAEGTYAVARDGQTLSVTTDAKSLLFQRASSAVCAVMAAALLTACASAGRPGQTAAVALRADADIQAIESLNRHDISAALASDVDAVASQWTDDFVLIPPAGPAVRGRAANVAMMEQARPQLDRFEPVAYEVHFEEIIVAGDYAFAWGQFTSAARPRDGGPDIVSNGKLLRIYQRQPDGRWLMHRTMAAADPTRR